MGVYSYMDLRKISPKQVGFELYTLIWVYEGSHLANRIWFEYSYMNFEGSQLSNTISQGRIRHNAWRNLNAGV